MNTKVLCVVVIFFTFLIFWGNQSRARNSQDDGSCYTCKCEVQMTVKNPDSKKEPSCSVIFKGSDKRISSSDDELLYLGVKEIKFSPVAFAACDFALYCDSDTSAELNCDGVKKTNEGFLGTTKYVKIREHTSVWGQQKCGVYCERRGDIKDVNIKCDHWERPPPPPPVKKPPVKKPPAKRPGLLSSMFVPASWQSPATDASFLTDSSGDQSEDEKEPDAVITDASRWKTLSGESGIEQGTLMVAAGETEVRSYCTGDMVRLAGPSMLSLPNCQPDIGGRWKGAYAKRLPNGQFISVDISLNLRKEAGSLKGEMKTPDGIFTIMFGSQSGYTLNVQTSGTVAGAKREIYFNGNLAKGSIVFTGRDQEPGGMKGTSIRGFVRRLYIADSALPIALVNTPYTHPLTAFAPAGQALKFRLAAPPVTYPEINWYTPAEATRGRNGEKFSYVCPANGSMGGTLYGSDTYSDSSTICKAAVHAGVITQKAGGVVTIQVKPNADTYTATTRNGVVSSKYSFGTGKGSFVFVSSNAGERGRLPKGISFDTSSGTFSGTPTETGSFDLMVVADDGAGNVFEQPLTLNVKKLAVTNALMPDGILAQSYAASLLVAGGVAPYSFSGKMPAGLFLDPVTGVVSGTPSSISDGKDRYGNRASTTTFDVTVKDSQNNSESQKMTLTVRGATIMNSHFLPDASVGAPYRTQFRTLGTTSQIYWTAGRADPKLLGLTLNGQTGELSGTPTKAGRFLINIRAEVGGGVLSRSFTVTIE
ncbi:MAG: putative Ig domain-containing protein [Pyrinomonadaceae bacterium]